MNLDTTLERCLQQIEAGESIDGCLARYQDQADALAPMLATPSSPMTRATKSGYTS